MKPKSINGVEIFAPGDAQACDKGDPNKTMDEAEQFLERSTHRFYKAGFEDDKSTVQELLRDTGRWISWVRHQYTFLGDSRTWDGPTQARYRAIRGWVEAFYQQCSEKSIELHRRSKDK